MKKVKTEIKIDLKKVVEVIESLQKRQKQYPKWIKQIEDDSWDYESEKLERVAYTEGECDQNNYILNELTECIIK
jgi:hypothetical protein